MFNKIYEKYSAIVMNRCRRILANEEDRQEAFQEVFQKVALNLDTFSNLDSPVAWLYRVTTNVCLNIIRSQKSCTLLEPQNLESLVSVTENQFEHQDFLLKTFSRLTEREKEEFIYIYYDGMSQEDVCSVLSISRATLNRDLSQIRKKFGREQQAS